MAVQAGERSRRSGRNDATPAAPPTYWLLYQFDKRCGGTDRCNVIDSHALTCVAEAIATELSDGSRAFRSIGATTLQ
jgi:hypothetical protein